MCDTRHINNMCIGENMFKFYYITPSNLDNLILISDGTNLTSLYFETNKDSYSLLDHKEDSTLDIYKNTSLYLDTYFKGKKPSFTPLYKLDNITPFQQEVYNIIKDIPYGKTLTYGNIASLIASKRGIKKMSSEAVGQALKKNPICIIIPCHRVIGKSSLGGYNGGIKNKLALLNIEGERNE